MIDTYNQLVEIINELVVLAWIVGLGCGVCVALVVKIGIHKEVRNETN